MNWISRAVDFVITWLGYAPTVRREATIEVIAVCAFIGIGVLAVALLTQTKKASFVALLGGMGGAGIGSVFGLGTDQGSIAFRMGAIVGVLTLAGLVAIQGANRRALTQRVGS